MIFINYSHYKEKSRFRRRKNTPRLQAFVDRQLTVNKLCVTNVKEIMKHLVPAFNDVVPEEKRRRLTPAELLDCWSGDIGLNSMQAVDRCAQCCLRCVLVRDRS